MLQKFDPNHSLSGEIIISDYETKKVLQHIQAESFVINFINKLYTEVTTTLANCTDTAGVARTMATASNFLKVSSNAGDDLYGIVVGTGTNAVALTDYQLQTKIAHGITAGALQYSGHSFLLPVTVGSERYFDVIRLFSNASGGDITINEIGLYFLDGGGSFKFMMDRTLATQVVTHTSTIEIKYRIKISV